MIYMILPMVRSLLLIALVTALILNEKFRKDILTGEGEASLFGIINVKGVVIVILSALLLVTSIYSIKQLPKELLKKEDRSLISILQKQKELERIMPLKGPEEVAKDWCRVINASQVIPLYPPNEDLQPGDIFLVQLSTDRQHEIYTQRGFLPLDNRIDRINPTGYEKFYEKSFEVGGEKRPLPKFWLSAGRPDRWCEAPYVSFPAYSFSVRSAGGFNLPFPIQGVPIGLSLLGANAAEGTVILADAHTYGLDMASLYRDIMAWASANRAFLKVLAGEGDKKNYLRVITRVYFAGRLNISLQSSRSVVGEVSGVAPKLVSSPGTEPQGVTLEAYAENIKMLNQILERGLKEINLWGVDEVLPGSTVKVVSASADSISLLETFYRPIVIGYLGFDIPIGPGGVLSPHLGRSKFVQMRVDQILDSIDKLSPENAFELNEKVPVRDQELEQIVELRDPEGRRLAIDKKGRKGDEQVAKEMLKTRVVLGDRSDTDLSAWEAAIKVAE